MFYEAQDMTMSIVAKELERLPPDIWEDIANHAGAAKDFLSVPLYAQAIAQTMAALSFQAAVYTIGSKGVSPRLIQALTEKYINDPKLEFGIQNTDQKIVDALVGNNEKVPSLESLRALIEFVGNLFEGKFKAHASEQAYESPKAEFLKQFVDYAAASGLSRDQLKVLRDDALQKFCAHEGVPFPPPRAERGR